MSSSFPINPSICLRRVRLHRATGDPLHARQRFEQALAPLGSGVPGLPDHALLVVRRMVVDLRLHMDPASVTSAVRPVQAALVQHARAARRPWLHDDAATADAVLFADKIELAACIIRDELRCDLGWLWWPNAVLGGMSGTEWWRRDLLPRGDLLPPVLALLAGRGLAVPWLARLSETEAMAATNSVAAAYALTLFTGSQPAESIAPGGTSGTPDVDRIDATEVADARARLDALVPEVELAGSAPRARLLALALGLQRAPAWVRAPEFGLALRALVAGSPIPADGHPSTPGTTWREVPGAMEGLASVGPPTSHPQPDPASRPPPPAAKPGRTGPADRWGARDISLTPLTSAAAAGRHPALPAVGIGGADAPPPVPHPPDHPSPTLHQGSHALVRVIPQPRTGPDGTQPTNTGPSKVRAGRVARIGPTQPVETPTAGSSAMETTHPPVVPSCTPDAATASAIPDVSAAPKLPSRTWRPDAIDPEGRGDLVPAQTSALFAESVETAHGGLLYLLNLALALGLYGDFTQPSRPGIALSPWDWLALVGRAWLGRRIKRDPLWHLLARLAGRPPEQSPGLEFAPQADWSIPPDWLLPWGAAGPIGVQRRGDRLRLWHPAGFLLAELHRSAGSEALTRATEVLERWPTLTAAPLVRLSRPPAGDRPDRARAGSVQCLMPKQRDLARWLGRLLPYLEARLALALGEDGLAAVPALVCRHQALIQVSATALDVHLSLDALPIAIRIAGLDRDPGWIPAAGRSVAFHFA